MRSSRSTAGAAQPAHDSDRVSRGEIIAYGLGGFAGTLPNQFRMQFHMNFMTDVAGLNIGVVGVWTMLLSVWDAINDPIVGRIVDRTETRWGKYRLLDHARGDGLPAGRRRGGGSTAPTW